MTEIPDDATLSQELDMLMARAGLTVPADRKAPLLLGFKDLRQMIARLHQPRPATSEPAATYDIRTLTRAL